MLDKLVAGLVTTHLGKYFENVNKEQVRVSLWSGHVRLRNLCFRKDALRAWDTAICVKEGSIEELTVVIPWTRLQSECVVVVVKKVRVVLQQKTVAGYDPEREKQEAYERKVHQLNIFEELLRREVFENEEHITNSNNMNNEEVNREGLEGENYVEAQKDATFSARLKANILNNVQLKLEDVIVRYEGCHTFERNFEKGMESFVKNKFHSISLSLSHFCTYACNEKFEPHFTATRERILYKKVELEGMRVFLDDEVVPLQKINTSQENNENVSFINNSSNSSSNNNNKESLQLEELPFLEISELSNQLVSSLRKPLNTGCHCIISPFSAVARVQYQPVPYRGELPMTCIDVSMNSLRATLNREQWLVLLSLWREIRNGEEYDVLRQFRPSGSGKLRPSDDPRAWWQYVIQVTLYRIRKSRERRVFVWESYKWLKAAREEYMMLFRRSRRVKLGANWLTPLTEKENKRLCELEMDLPIDSIKFARRLAYQRTQLERKNRDAVLEKRRLQQQQQQQQQQQEEEEKKEKILEEDNSYSSITDSTIPVVQKETSGWWGWMTSSWTRRTQDEESNLNNNENEDSPDISEEIEEMLRLVHAERWTNAQRLAIAKEFGISENEMEDLADTGGISIRAPDGLQWQLRFHAKALQLTLCESVDSFIIPFGTLAMERLTVDFAYTTNKCFDLTLNADEYLVLSHLAEEEEKKEKEKQLLQQEIQSKEEKEQCALSVIRVARERFDDQTASAVSLTWRRLRPCGWADNDTHTVPYELRLNWNPLDCIVNVPFLRTCIDFIWIPTTTTTTRGGTTTTVVRNEGKNVQPSSLYSSSSLRVSPPTGERRRTLLMLVVEREILCDWSMSVYGVRIIAAEDARQATRIALRSLKICNDPVKKLEKRRRIQEFSKTIPDKSGVFGDNEEDWVNNVHASVEGVTVECCLISQTGSDYSGVVSSTSVAIGVVNSNSNSNTSSSSSENRDFTTNPHVQWECIATIPYLSMQFKKSLMMHRSPDIPLISTSLNITEPLQFHCSRWSLSVLCTSFSLISDFCQTMLQRSAMGVVETKTKRIKTTSCSCSENLIFYAQIRAVEERFLFEHETSSKWIYEQHFRTQGGSLDDIDAYHRMEIANGKLTIYHATRSSFPSHLFELHKGHIHIEQNAEEVSIFIESGGVPHECRKGLWKAKKVLFNKYKFPILESMILLESLIIKWCQEHKDNIKDIQEVKEAFHIVQSASRTQPCHYICLKCINVEEAEYFANAIETHAIDNHIFAIPADPTTEEEEEEKEEKKKSVLQEPCQFVLDVTVPHCTLFLHEENMINSSSNEGIMPVYEVIITGTKLSYEQQKNEKVVNFIASGLSVLSQDKTVRVLDLVGSSEIHSALNVSFQLKHRPYPHPARKYINIKISDTVKLSFSSEFLAIIEFLWDLTGILTNQVFSHTLYCSVPWSMEPAVLVEEEWRRDRKGGLLQRHFMNISIEHFILSLYYPSDTFEKSEEVLNGIHTSTDFIRAVNNGDEPMAIMEGSNVNVCWNNTESCNATELTIQNPQMTMIHLTSGERLRVVYSDSRNTEETVLEKEENNNNNNNNNNNTSCPNISFSFTIHRELPILSKSDFIANGGPYGYRYTHFLSLSGSHFHALYWHSQLWDLIEICSRGIISRAAAIVWRKPYIAGMNILSSWSYFVNTMIDITPPFTWCLMRKDIQLSHIQLTLPHEDANVPSMLWGKVKELSFHDTLINVQGGKEEEEKEEEKGSNQEERVVQQLSRLKLEGFDILGIRKKNQQTSTSSSCSSSSLMKIVTLLNGKDFILDFSYELFRVNGWVKSRPRIFSIKISDSAVFHGTTNQFALLIDWLYGNYMKTPWKGHFAPKKVAVDPFIFPQYNHIMECNTWIVQVEYICLRLHDPPQSYQCVEKETNFTNYVRTGIDIGIVVKGLFIEFNWDSSGNFFSQYSVNDISVWELEASARNRVIFSYNPSESVHESFRFLRIHHKDKISETFSQENEKRNTQTNNNNNNNNNDNDNDDKSKNMAKRPVALKALYSVKFEEGEKKVSSYININTVDITPIPSFLYNLKDSLFSLRVRNAFGKILRWEPRVAGVIIEPPTSENQDWFTNHQISLDLLNITISAVSNHRRRLVPLFFASIMNIQFRNTSEKYGLNSEWSISIDNIDKNGAFMSKTTSEGGIELRPIILSKYWRQGEEYSNNNIKLFQVMKTVSGGLVGNLNSIWILLPLKREIYALRDIFIKDGYTQLSWLGTFLEERKAWRMGTLCSKKNNDNNNKEEKEKEETNSLLVNFTIKEPCIVVAEHDSIITGNLDIEKGVLYNLGDITINRKGVSIQDDFQLSFSALSVKSLQDNSQYVMEPIAATISLYCDALNSGNCWEVKVRLGSIAINVTQSMYELILHSVVRHFVSKEAEIPQFITAERERFLFYRALLPLGDSAEVELNKLHKEDDKDKKDEKEEKEEKLGNGGLKVRIEWESFTLNVLRETIGFFVATGEMSALYDVLTTEHQKQEEKEEYEYKEDNDNNNDNDNNEDNSEVIREKKIHVSLAFIRLGVENGVHLVDLQPLSSITSSLTEPRLLLSLDGRDKEEVINVNLGKCVLFLEKNVIMLLISTLYEPYRRIVLQEYREQEIKYIDSDVKLHEQLILSKRRKVKVVRDKYNHITIDGNGYDIHFIDAGSPLLSLGEGLTLRIINAHIYLYGKAIEYYMVTGNGSYVVADSKYNTIIHDMNPPLTDIYSISSEPILSGPESEGYGNFYSIQNIQSTTINTTAVAGNSIGSRSNSNSSNSNNNNNNNNNNNQIPLIELSNYRSHDISRRIFGNAILLLTLPEVTDESELQLRRGSHTTQPSRSLVLQASMSACVEMIRSGGYIDENSTFDLTEFAVRCEYINADGTVVDTTSLVSQWAVSVHVEAHSQLRSPLERRIEITCLRGIEIRLRFADVSFCWRAVLQAKEALGHIESSVLDDFSTGKEFTSPYEMGWREKKYTSEEGETTVVFHLRYLSIDIVDDSTNVDIPLFRCRIENIATPKAVKKGVSLKLHISCDWSIIYYNFTSSSWCPLLEPVSLDIVLRRESNISLEDVKQRKGFLRAGLHLRAVRLHFSTIVAENLRRLWLLKKNLENALYKREVVNTNNAPTTTNNTIFTINTINNNNNNNNSSVGNSMISSVNGSKPQGISKLEFYTYKVAQHVGQDLHIHFAQDNQNRFPPPCVLRANSNDVLEFNFPRIEGHELPASQHCFVLSFRDYKEFVNVANTGRRLVRVGPGMMSSHVLVDITVSQGQKLVEFRTNIGFENELPFAMEIGSVGIIQSGEKLHIPIHALRDRTSFTPITSETGRNIACSLGVSYDMLSLLYDQVFLCMSKADIREVVDLEKSACSSASLQKSVFFLLRFGPKILVGNSNVLDCKGTFEAPFFIINGTSLPMQVGLMYRKAGSHNNYYHNRPFMEYSDSNYFEHITTLDIAADERCAITQVNPLKDIYIDVFIAQANGESMGRVFGSWRKRQMPVLVHSSKKRDRGHTITLHDSKGSSIILHIDYTARAITIWCPYWIVNQTPHSLQFSDVKKGNPVAGLRNDEGIPSGFNNIAYILNSERMEKLGDKAIIYLCIGRKSSKGILKWTMWSDRILIGALNECGIVSCALTKQVCVSLTYTVRFLGGRTNATRIITFSPRWIIENHMDNSIAFRQCLIKVDYENVSSLSSIPMDPDQSHIIDLSSEGDVANAIQVHLTENESKGIRPSQWSQPLYIDKLGDRTFNLVYETYIKVQDTKEHHTQLDDETLVHLGNDTFIRRSVSDVLMISCYRKSSIMHVVLSKPQRPPHVIENRTRYLVYVRQRDIPQRMIIYPRTTRGFAWEDVKALPVMEVWAAEGINARSSRSILINFDPQAVVKRSAQLQQELHLPSGGILFVRVRELGGMSYAISVTTESTIDAFCALPYFQYSLKLEVDGIHTLFSYIYDDFILLTVKPVTVSFSQGAEADGNGDEQTFEFSLRVIQIDDERASAKQSVVAQLVDAKPSVIRFKRKLSRVAPILYIKDFLINVSSVEIHLEDSFLFQVMKYCEEMRIALGGKNTGMTREKMDHYFTWMNSNSNNNNNNNNTLITPMRKKKTSKDAWKQHIIFIDHILLEQVMISISLYRSPGAHNDPMWESIGYLSFLIRSVRDARFVWRRIEQRGVYETLWLLGISYYSYYKHQLMQQVSNVVHVAGLDMMRGFVTDLLQGYFSSDVLTHIDRTKQRIGRRSEAHFAKDENISLMRTTPDTEFGFDEQNQRIYNNNDNSNNNSSNDNEFIFSPRFPTPPPPLYNNTTDTGVVDMTSLAEMTQIDTVSTSNMFTRSIELRKMNNHPLGKHNKIVEAALLLPWSAFYARVSDSELRAYGIYAVQRFLRSLDFSNPSRMQWQFQDLATGAAAITNTTNNNNNNNNNNNTNNPTNNTINTTNTNSNSNTINSTWESHWRCDRCGELRRLRARRFESASLSALPHPASGLLGWAEFTHHVSWAELVAVCTPAEVRRYAGVVLRALAGDPRNVIRVEEREAWILGEEEKE